MEGLRYLVGCVVGGVGVEMEGVLSPALMSKESAQ